MKCEIFGQRLLYIVTWDNFSSLWTSRTNWCSIFKKNGHDTFYWFNFQIKRIVSFILSVIIDKKLWRIEKSIALDIDSKLFQILSSLICDETWHGKSIYAWDRLPRRVVQLLVFFTFFTRKISLIDWILWNEKKCGGYINSAARYGVSCSPFTRAAGRLSYDVTRYTSVLFSQLNLGDVTTTNETCHFLVFIF